MSFPLFTHQCGGCKALMDLHPALRDYHAGDDLPDSPDALPRKRGRSARPVFPRARLASVCVACVALVLGSLIVF